LAALIAPFFLAFVFTARSGFMNGNVCGKLLHTERSVPNTTPRGEGPAERGAAPPRRTPLPGADSLGGLPAASAWFEKAEWDFYNQPTADLWDACLRYECSEDERCRASPPGPVPCCEDKLLQMASDLGSFFTQLNLTYFAGFSTLLGIVRNGSVQPNGVNMDIDFVLGAPSYDLLASQARGTMARLALFKKVRRDTALSRSNPCSEVQSQRPHGRRTAALMR
jgi:hypothetical protein